MSIAIAAVILGAWHATTAELSERGYNRMKRIAVFVSVVGPAICYAQNCGAL